MSTGPAKLSPLAPSDAAFSVIVDEYSETGYASERAVRRLHRRTSIGLDAAAAAAATDQLASVFILGSSLAMRFQPGRVKINDDDEGDI